MWRDFGNQIVKGDWGIPIRCAIYLVVNCTQPLLVDIIKYNGGARPSTLSFIVPTYFAMLFVGFFPTEKSIWRCDWRKAMIVSVTDALHQFFEKAGLVYAGSAVYMIVASSSIVWTAILSIFLLGRHVSLQQWFGIGAICLGLALRSLIVEFSWGNDEVIGIFMTGFAAMLHGFAYVYNEKCLTGEDAIEGPNLVCMIGIINTGVLGLWTCVWTVPRFEELVASSIRAKNGSPTVIAMCFCGLLVLSFIRSAVLWYLVKHIGSISAGALKGLRSGLVFVVCHFAFCHLQKSQCMTVMKALAAAVCVIGVILYSSPPLPIFDDKPRPARELAQTNTEAESDHCLLPLPTEKAAAS